MQEQELRTLNYYDGISKGYKELYWSEQTNKIEKIKLHLIKSGVALDCGSGDGVLNRYFDNKTKLISADISFRLLKLNSNKSKVNCSITNLPFKDKSFDQIICLSVIQDVDDISNSISELSRILKNESSLILSHIKISSKQDKIKESLDNYFSILEIIEEEKDIIYLCSNR